MIFGREPSLWIGFIQAVIALAVTFGFNLSAEQVGAVMAVVTMGASVWTRSLVRPVKSDE